MNRPHDPSSATNAALLRAQAFMTPSPVPSISTELLVSADGELNRSEWLKRFYFGESDETGLQNIVDHVGDSDPRSINSIRIADDITLRTGKYGPYLEVQADPETQGADENGRRIVNIPEGLAPDELTEAKARELIAAPVFTDRVLGKDPASGLDVLFKDGRYGPYVMLDDEKNPKPKSASLFKSMSAETIDLETALKLLSLPRVLGNDPETNQEITVQNGKYGPYLKKGTDSRSIESEEMIFEIDLAKALEIYSLPKYGARRTAATPLREFGEDPASGQLNLKSDVNRAILKTLRAHGIEVVLRLLAGGTFPGFWVLLAPVLEVALWPLASWVLLAPQRRPPDRDENRPL